MKRKKRFLSIVLLLLFFGTACGASKTKDQTKSKTQDKTNTTPALYTLQEQKEVLKKYPNFYDLAFQKQSTEEQEGTYVVPGLKSTETLALEETGQPEISNTMDPQGVAIVEDYLVISAYSHDFQHNSVLYVLNKKTHEYIKTVVLQGKPHVGGIAYDAQSQNLWICSGGKDKKAQIVSIPLKTLKDYQFSKGYEPVDYDQIIDLGDIGEASFISYHEQALYIGFFSIEHAGILNKYSIDKNGQFNKEVEQQVTFDSDEDDTVDVDKVEPEYEYKITRKIQGLTFYKNKILFSQSYGPEKSHILVFDDLNKEHIFLERDAGKIIETPPYLEQITADHNSVYAIFESATEKYREDEFITKVDRVLQLDAKKLIEKDK